MSNGPLRLLAGAGAGDDPVYVDDVFSTFLYAGNDSGQSIVNGIDLSGEGGLVWLAGMSNAVDQQIYDTVRGVRKPIYSNRTNSEGAPASGYALTTFNNNGFTLGTNWNTENFNPYTYCSWTFRKAEKFFDIVTYTGDGSTSKTISHNLGSTPGMIIVKCTSSSYRWNVWHRDLTNATTNTNPSNAYIVKLNTTDAQELTSSGGIADVNGSTFDVGGVFANNTGETFVAYLFGHNEAEYGTGSDEAIIKCGSFTGNGNDNGPEIDLGFEPQFYLFKKIGGTGSWFIYDSMRGLTAEGSSNQYINANYDYGNQSSDRIEITSTGIKVHDSNDTWNENNKKFIYMAIRRPHKPATEFAATDLFVVDQADNTDSKEPKFRTTFPVDFAIDNWATQSNQDKHISSRLIQGNYIRGNSNDAEASESSYMFDYNNGFYAASGATSGQYAWMFRRAKGFFDVVTYKSNTTYPNTFNHNLGAVPELILIKRRDSSSGGAWAVYSSTTGNTKHLVLSADSAQASSSYWNNTTPTSTVVTVGGQDETWGYGGYRYIAYLFATVAGISKVGSYTGTGSDLNVDCGFSAGARFILIKYYTNPGDWYLFDSVRGIVAGNDPYTLLNSNAVQVTGTDYIDPLSSGFTVTSSAPAGMNEDGGQYIFLAIA